MDERYRLVEPPTWIVGHLLRRVFEEGCDEQRQTREKRSQSRCLPLAKVGLAQRHTLTVRVDTTLATVR